MKKCIAYKMRYIKKEYYKKEYYNKEYYRLYINSKKRSNHSFDISGLDIICIKEEYRLQIRYSYSRVMVSTKFNKKNFDRLTQILNSVDHSIEIFCIGMTDFLNKIGIDYDYYKRK